eukprot:1111848-Rhodomonas_salina.2
MVPEGWRWGGWRPAALEPGRASNERRQRRPSHLACETESQRDRHTPDRQTDGHKDGQTASRDATRGFRRVR